MPYYLSANFNHANIVGIESTQMAFVSNTLSLVSMLLRHGFSTRFARHTKRHYFDRQVTFLDNKNQAAGSIWYYLKTIAESNVGQIFQSNGFFLLNLN